jgi:hypothetical protein
VQRDARTHPRLAAFLAASLPESASLALFEPERLDQGPTSSCTAHSLSAAISTACSFAGRPIGVPSQRELYAVTRAIERATEARSDTTILPTLSDNGGMLADAVQAATLWGVCPMQGPTSDGRNSDVEPSNVNLEPDLLALEKASTTIVTGTHRIDETASDVVDQACAAIAAGFPVYDGFFVDSAFEQWTRGSAPIAAPNLNDSSGGGHAVYLSGYTTVAGSRVFTLSNSWGRGWGDDGRCLVSEAWLRACWDLYVIDVKVLR